MVQEEVARRVVANEKSPSKQYGFLTILSQFWADCEIFKLVGRKSFYPAPKVNSALIRLIVKKEPRLKLSDYKHFRKTIKAAFAQRRKTLSNALSAGFSELSKEQINAVIADCGFESTIRGERLDIAQFVKLSDKIGEFIK